MGNGNKKKRKKRKSTLFIKTFLLTMSVFVILVFAALLTLISTAKPPVIARDIYVGTPNLDDSIAFHSPDAHEDDLLIGDGYLAPAGFSSGDRKKLFYTFLIVGIDKGVNTDTIMVASYDGEKKVANIIGIPRDSLMNVKRSIKKINAAYPAGTLNGGGKEGGVAQLQREIKTIIGFVPDYYVLIDFKAFTEIIDAIDGINVYVPMNLDYDDPVQDLHIHISKGEQHLNGSDALKFARYRKGNNSNYTINDYQRIENQQAVIKATLEKLLNPVYISKIPEFIGIFSEHVTTDIKADEMIWFAGQLKNIKSMDALTTHTMPTSGTSGSPSYYEYLDAAAIVELVNSTINPYKKDIKRSDLDIISSGY